MIRIDKELIAEELERDIRNGFTFRYKTLSNKLLDKLLGKYYVVEACENFYDSEPSIDDYISDMAYMYECYTDEDENNPARRYTKKYILETYGKEYTKNEAEKCKIESNRIHNNYYNSDRRLKFCNWQEPYSEGIWNMSQKHVDKMSNDELKRFRKLSVKKRNRVYVAEKDDEIRIYLYGRDIMNKDWWFLFKRK